MAISANMGLLSTVLTVNNSPNTVSNPKPPIYDLLATERDYIQDLASICALKKALLDRRTLPETTISNLFPSVDGLLDFHCLFRTTLENVSASRYWPDAFVDCEVALMSAYRLYATTLAKALRQARHDFDRIRGFNHPCVTDLATFERFLILPCARIAEYTSLMKSVDQTRDAVDGCCLQRALVTTEGVEQELDKSYLQEARDFLVPRVLDWGTVKQEDLGRLVLYDGPHLCTRPNQPGHKQAIEYEVYLFEKAMVMFKEIREGPNKGRLWAASTIWSSDVSDILTVAKSGRYMVHVWASSDIIVMELPTSGSFMEWASLLNRATSG